MFHTSEQSDHILFPYLIHTLPLLQILVVDSEASSLRALNLIEGYTKTVLGQDAPVSFNRLKILGLMHLYSLFNCFPSSTLL